MPEKYFLQIPDTSASRSKLITLKRNARIKLDIELRDLGGCLNGLENRCSVPIYSQAELFDGKKNICARCEYACDLVQEDLINNVVNLIKDGG